MCVDYRRLKSVTKSDSFPFPLLDQALDAFANVTILSIFDLEMAYYQVLVKPLNIMKIAFITHIGLYEKVIILFKLCNASSTYQQLMSGVLQGLLDCICLVYFDDVIVFVKSV